ncbi:hypothetical protein DL768_005912 [Monosporascus sp. mg162]|nr:hypothetical protein DL768_005912 [Monosporascus sp. mg162]
MIVRSGRHPPPLENGEDDGDDGDEEYESGREDGEDDPDAEDEDGEIEDRYNVMPPELEDGARSPVEGLKRMQWDDVDKELEEFMGSEIDDSDMDGTDRGLDTDREEEQQPKGQKRKYGEETEDEDGESSSTQGGSALAKKQRRAKARTTGLRNVRNATEEGDDAEGGEDGSGLPTPMVTGDEDGAGEEREDKDDDEGRDDDEDDGFSDLEAELEAELQAEMDTG